MYAKWMASLFLSGGKGFLKEGSDWLDAKLSKKEWLFSLFRLEMDREGTVSEEQWSEWNVCMSSGFQFRIFMAEGKRIFLCQPSNCRQGWGFQVQGCHLFFVPWETKLFSILECSLLQWRIDIGNPDLGENLYSRGLRNGPSGFALRFFPRKKRGGKNLHFQYFSFSLFLRPLLWASSSLGGRRRRIEEDVDCRNIAPLRREKYARLQNFPFFPSSSPFFPAREKWIIELGKTWKKSSSEFLLNPPFWSLVWRPFFPSWH